MVSDSQSKVYCPYCFGAWESMWWGILLPAKQEGGWSASLRTRPQNPPWTAYPWHCPGNSALKCDGDWVFQSAATNISSCLISPVTAPTSTLLVFANPGDLRISLFLSLLCNINCPFQVIYYST